MIQPLRTDPIRTLSIRASGTRDWPVRSRGPRQPARRCAAEAVV